MAEHVFSKPLIPLKRAPKSKRTTTYTELRLLIVLVDHGIRLNEVANILTKTFQHDFDLNNVCDQYQQQTGKAIASAQHSQNTDVQEGQTDETIGPAQHDQNIDVRESQTEEAAPAQHSQITDVREGQTDKLTAHSVDPKGIWYLGYRYHQIGMA